MNLLEQIKRIERVDQLIRMKATGTPNELAKRLKISERSTHRLIEIMKSMGAPIYYNVLRQSYCYKENVYFKFGFFVQDYQSKRIFGGKNSDIDFLYNTAKFWQYY